VPKFTKIARRGMGNTLCARGENRAGGDEGSPLLFQEGNLTVAGRKSGSSSPGDREGTGKDNAS